MTGNVLVPVAAIGALVVSWLTGYGLGLGYLQIKRVYEAAKKG